MGVTVAKQQGSGREAVAERSWRQKSDRRNTNWQRGRAWATSVLANAKSEDHPDTQGRARRRGLKVQVLTRGDLFLEKGGEVSRGRSSKESPRKREGAKGRRSHGKALQSIVRGANKPQRQQPRFATAARTCKTGAVEPREVLQGEDCHPHA